MSQKIENTAESKSELPANEIDVSKFEMTMLWPVLVQPLRKDEGALVDESLDPTKPHFLEKWADSIVDNSDKKWSHFDQLYPSASTLDATRGYAEFCYFHPFVRNFLYENRGDIRDFELRPRKASNVSGDRLKTAPNRNLRVLERIDINPKDNDAGSPVGQEKNRSNARLDVSYDLWRTGLDEQTEGWTGLVSSFELHRCRMYLFDTRVVILEVQLRHEGTLFQEGLSYDATGKPVGQELQLDLQQVQKLQDIVRRTYTPYWELSHEVGTVRQETRHVPDRLRLQIGDETMEHGFGAFEFEGEEQDLDALHGWRLSDLATKTICDDARHHREQVYEDRETPTVKFWRSLIAPIEPVTHINSRNKKGKNIRCPLQFEHIQDDRVPTLSYIAVGGPEDNLKGPSRKVRRISEGDWMRLAFMDDPGVSTTWPYSPKFFAGMSSPLEGVAYDRFWHPTGEVPAQDGFNTTRWMCCGYGLVGVGDGSDSDFFTNEEHGALCHFRHHYKSLTLIALFHRASLLKYKHRLAEISDEMLKANTEEDELNDAFRKSSERLAKEFMRFRTLYWFSEVTNHIQGTELFHMFRKHLNLDSIFSDVGSDIESATSLMRQWDESRQLKNSNQLATVAAILAMMVPLLLWVELGMTGNLNTAAHWSLGLLFVGLVLGVFCFVSIPLEWRKQLRLTFSNVREDSWLRRFVGWGYRCRGYLAAGMLIVGLLLLFFDPRSSPDRIPENHSATAGELKTTDPEESVPTAKSERKDDRVEQKSQSPASGEGKDESAATANTQ